MTDYQPSDGYEICDNCEGKGRVPYMTNLTRDGYQWWARNGIECPDCNGAGEVKIKERETEDDQED